MLNVRTLLMPGSDRHLLTRSPRVVEVVGELDETLLERCARQIHAIVASGQAYLPVVVHSSGGNLFDAMALLALLASSPVPVVTVCTGHAYSAGALVFSAGAPGHRYMAPYATLMLHQVSLAGIAGTAREVTNEARELERANAASFQRLAANTGRPPTYFSALVEAADGDVYLDAAAALHHGLATHIGVPHLEVRVAVQLHVCTGAWTPPSSAAATAVDTLTGVGVGGGGGGGGSRKRRRVDSEYRDDEDGGGTDDDDDDEEGGSTDDDGAATTTTGGRVGPVL